MEIRTFYSDYPDEAIRDTAELQQMFADGTVRPYIGARFPLSRPRRRYVTLPTAEHSARSSSTCLYPPSPPPKRTCGRENPHIPRPFVRFGGRGGEFGYHSQGRLYTP